MSGIADDPLFAALTPVILAYGLFLTCVAIWPRPTAIGRAMLLSVSVAFMVQYTWWRVSETLPSPAFNAEFAIAVGFLMAETAGAIAAALSILFLLRTRDRSVDADANAEWLVSEAKYPSVDVLICSYNEDRSILERTIVGAQAMNYPNFRVWMLDDSRRDWLKILCARLGCRYVSRPDNSHAKAGNINHALRLIAELPDPPAFISILDADFVPTPQFLKRAMTLFRDETIGVVQTPQHFVNPDPIQINLGAAKFWPDEQRYFFDVVMPAKDAWSAAFCCGTSSIIRFKPLLAIGGFPTDSLTEDYLLTLRLKETGYATAYLNEPLSYGLAPEGLKEYVGQRSRWCLGFMQIARGRSGPLSRASALTFLDRIALTETFLNWTAVYVSRAVGLTIPVLSLALDIHPFQTSLPSLATHFLPYWLWNGLTMHWLSGGRIMPILSDVSQVIVMPQILRAIVVGLWRPQGHKFEVTAKGGDRGRGFVEWGLMRPFAILIGVSMLAIVYAFYVNGRVDTIRYSGPALAWCWYNLLVLLALCFVCIEKPRMRGAERFDSRELAKLKSAGGQQIVQLADLSITGARIFGKSPLGLGERVELEFSDCRVAATIVRIEAEDFAIAFAHSFETRIAMIRRFYAGGYVKPLERIRILRVAAAVVRRVLD
jgi:cellulose synthase/poly-beta-1,6-N-acetylglucosamine synthase-like glycosyltransferase